MTTITKSIVFNWKLYFSENYKWTTTGQLYNTKTMREIKKTVNGYSVGYWINKKFWTLCKIKKTSCKNRERNMSVLKCRKK